MPSKKPSGSAAEGLQAFLEGFLRNNTSYPKKRRYGAVSA
jgi:hypothetical protein